MGRNLDRDLANPGNGTNLTQELRVWPAHVIVPPGEIVRLEAQVPFDARRGEGAWTSSEPFVATIDPTGIVQCRNPGTTMVRFTLGGMVAEAKIEVRRADPFRLNIVSSVTRFEDGENGELIAIAEFSNGMTRDLSSEVRWKSSDPRIVAVGPDGRVTAHAPGRTRVSASWRGLKTERNLAVEPKRR
jgi:hypothetical protein